MQRQPVQEVDDRYAWAAHEETEQRTHDLPCLFGGPEESADGSTDDTFDGCMYGASTCAVSS